MALPPSRKDTLGAPKPGRNITDLSALVRHHGSYLRSLDPGYLDGRFATPKPVPPGLPAEDVGGDDSGDAGQDEILFHNTDQFVIDGPGDKTFELTYIPIDDAGSSLQAFWVPNRLSFDSWTLDDNIISVIDPGWRADDLFEVAYAYEYDGEPEPSDVISDYGINGDIEWRWIQISIHDGSVAYADPAYDDSAWAIARAPFGETTPPHDGVLGDYISIWNQGTRMWGRKDIAAEPGVDVIIKAKWNRALRVHWNGNWKGTATQVGEDYLLFTTIPGDQVLASNLIACQVTDDAFSGPHTGCYFDLGVFQVNGEAPL